VANLETFKLSNGASVTAGSVRTGIVSRAAGVLADVLVCGDGRHEVGILAWPSVSGCRELAGGELDPGALSVAEVVREHVRNVLLEWNRDNPEPGGRIGRALLLREAPHDDGADGTSRAANEADLFSDPPTAGVIVVPVVLPLR
jgi:feruloyl-CoA synthase